MSVTQMTGTHLRWMIRSDMDAVVAIEKESHVLPWTKAEFSIALRQSNAAAMVAERNDEVVGYIVYELHKNQITVLNLAVRERSRRLGVGSEILRRMKDKIDFQRRTSIEFELRESNVAGQLFARENGFLCTSIIHGWYADSDDAAYRFRFDKRGRKDGC